MARFCYINQGTIVLLCCILMAVDSMNKYPYQAVIYVAKGYHYELCTGVLISKKHVLTTNSCLNKAKDVKVTLGRSSLTASNILNGIKSNKWYTHGHYNSSTLQNDIAIVEINEPIEMYNDAVKPMELPPNSQFFDDLGTDKTVFISGWSPVDQPTDHHGVSLILYQAGIMEGPLMDYKKCKSIHRFVPDVDSNIITEDKICVDTTNSGHSIGHRIDQGAPAYVRKNNDTILVGIGTASGSLLARLPHVFVRVDQYRDWILDIIEAKETSETSPKRPTTPILYHTTPNKVTNVTPATTVVVTHTPKDLIKINVHGSNILRKPNSQDPIAK